MGLFAQAPTPIRAPGKCAAAVHGPSSPKRLRCHECFADPNKVPSVELWLSSLALYELLHGQALSPNRLVK